jgi:hypothetical protein
VEFISYKGKPSKVSALTLSQQEELAQFLRFKYFDECKSQFKDLPIKLAEYGFDKAKAKSDRIFPGTIEHAEQFFTPHGQAYGLMLALQIGMPTITVAEAYTILDECEDAAIKAVVKAVGYKSTGEPTNANKPLPVDQIYHQLCNEPHFYTIEEVRQMTLDDIALIWCNPADENKPIYTIADQQRAIQAAREKHSTIGIWKEENIWLL